MPLAGARMLVDTIDKPRRNSKDTGALVEEQLKR